MNVRSFASLNEILISSQSYDEDLFEAETSTRDNPPRFDLYISPIPKSPSAPDYANDLFDSDDHLPAIQMNHSNIDGLAFDKPETDSFIDEETINPVDAERSMSFEATSTGERRLTSESLGLSVDSINLVAQIRQSPVSLPSSEYVPVLRRPAFSNSNPVVVINNNSTVRLNLRQSQFSCIKKVSEKDFEILEKLKRRTKQVTDNNAPRQRNVTGDAFKRNGSLGDLTPTVINQIEGRSKAVSLVASRAIHVANADYGIDTKTADRVMCSSDRFRVYGIPDYDPDYDCACEMKDQNVTPTLPREFLPQRSGNFCLSQDESQNNKGLLRKSNTLPNYTSSNEVLSRSANKEAVRRFHDDSTYFPKDDAVEAEMFVTAGPVYPSEYLNRGGDSRSASYVEPSTATQHAAALKSPVAYRGAAGMVLDDIREGKVTTSLLRLGVEKDKLKSKSEDIHSSFLADLLGE